MARRQYIFNLLQPLKTPKTYWDKIYDWLIMRARVVIIIVEILIVVGFVGKIVVDNIGKNREQVYDDLRSQIDIVASSNEATFRTIQTKSDEYLKLWENSSQYGDVMEELSGYINFNTTTSITIDGYSLTISGFQALDEIDRLENNMKNSPNYSEVLTNLTLNEQDIQDNFGQFTINATLTEDSLKRVPIIPVAE